MSHSVPNALMTGADYLDSLRDGRQVYLNGERVADVTRHRAFRNACRSIAGLYDGLHGEQRDVLTRVDAQGRRSHRFFTPAQNAEDLLGARDAIGCWSRMTYGFMGRTPDYKAAFMSGLEAGAGFYGDYRQNACAWHRAFADRGLFLNHAIINPPLDRSKAIHEMRDVFVHVERETDQGIVVSGAKMLATGSAITNATFVAPVASAQMEAGKAEDFALVFFARMDNPGLRLMCRPSYEERASSPFDYPLSSRFDENDSVLLFDKALIPWEDVLVYRDLRRATGFYAESGFANLYNFQSGIRLGVKLELMIGLLSLGVRANGTQGFRGIQAALGELIALQHLLQALTTAMARDPERNAAGSAVPRLEYANALRIQVPQIWKRVRELLESALGGAPLVTVSGAADLRDGEARRLVDSYYRGAELEPEQRLKLFKLIWDATGSEFGARHAVYESHYSGGCLSALLSLPLAAAVPGPDAPADLARGKAMAQKMCSRCHDDDGNGGPRPNRSYPKLAGLDREYLYKQIYDLKTQRRRNPATNGRGEELSAADVVNVSAWFAAQRMSAGEQTLADPRQRERGRQLFENGLAQRGVPPCVTCHGPAAQGLAALKAPRLAGQWAEYLATQLHGFRDGKRGNSATMRAVAGGLEDSDIQALAGYLGSLGP